MKSKREYFANLDMLRFLAALWVVITHYGYIGPATGVTGYGVTDSAFAASFFKYGYLGVPLFFILSGFVIAHVSANASGWKDAPQFMANRISRLMPAFWACMTISAIALAFFGLPDMVSIQTWFANLILLPQILGQPFVDGVYWTLVLEFVFYTWVFILVGFGLFHKHLLAICSVWLVISLSNILVFEIAVLELLFITYFSGAFVAGMVIWHARRNRWTMTHLMLMAYSVLSLGLGIQDLGTRTDYPEFFAAPSFSISILWAFICIGIVFLGIFLKDVPVKKSFALALGAISYPLYLLHQEFGYAVLRHATDMGLNPLFMGLVLIGFFVGLAYLVHLTLEKPIRNALIKVLDVILSIATPKQPLQPAE